MNIRRMFFGVIILCFTIVAFPMPVSAMEYVTDMPSDMDVDAVKEEVVSWINTCDLAPRSRMITKDDVDLSKAFKYYGVNGEIFDIPSSNFNEVKQQLENEMYFFEVPVYLDGNTWVVGIMLRGPVSEETYKKNLSEEGIAYLESLVGKWVAFRIGCYESEMYNPYETAAEATGISDKQPILVGVIPNLTHSGVAIFPDNEGNLDKMVSLTPLYKDSFELLALEESASDVLITDYAHAKAILEKIPTESDGFDADNVVSAGTTDKSSSNNDSADSAIGGGIATNAASPVTRILLIGGITIIVLAVVGIAFWRIRKRKKN